MSNSAVSAVAGAIVGACVGAVIFTSTAPSNMYTTVASSPVAVTAPITRVAPSIPLERSQRSVRYATAETEGPFYGEPEATQGFAVSGLSVAVFAGAVAAIAGIWNRRVAMASATGRREALLSGIAAAGLTAGPAMAAYGDKAALFGAPKEVEQVFTISGDGWTGIMPGKYNASKERDAPGMVGRWEDNFDAVNNSFVIVRQGPNSIKDLGDLDAVRASVVTPLLGEQAFDGASISEGGFAPGRYSAAAVLDQREAVKDGKVYYYYNFLTRTADGNEGGRHQLYVVTASNGKLYVFKQQAGDKRWFKGLERPLKASIEAFTVA